MNHEQGVIPPSRFVAVGQALQPDVFGGFALFKRLLACVALLALTSVAFAQETDPKKIAEKIDKGDTAWMMVSTALVLLMVPGLALFYGGMVRRKNILATMMHSMVALSIVGLQWVLYGYSLAFGASKAGWIGWSPEFLGLSNEQL